MDDPNRLKESEVLLPHRQVVLEPMADGIEDVGRAALAAGKARRITRYQVEEHEYGQGQRKQQDDHAHETPDDVTENGTCPPDVSLEQQPDFVG